jgi:hypothetical protein
MKFKYVVIDFIHYVFSIALVAFCIFYFLAGDRFMIFGKFIKSLVPLSIFGLIFLLKFRFSKQSYHKQAKENNLNEIIKYITRTDKIKDIVVISLSSIFILGSSFFISYISMINILQALLIFFVMFFWHRFLFKKDNVRDISYLTNLDKLKDEIAIFLIPIIFLGLAITDGEINIFEISQGIIVFLIIYAWHRILFKGKT